jgi:predicted  nucleic acid-binding Zn-ribbon protein
VEENNTRVNSYINGIESRLTESIESVRDDLTRELNAVHAKGSNQAEELRRLVEGKDAEMVTATRKQYKALSEELDSTRRRLAENYDALSAHVKEDTDRKVGRLQQNLTQAVGELRTAHNKQAGFMCDLEEGFAAQLDTLQAQLRDLSATHRTHAQTVTDTHKTLESRLQELTTTLQTPACHPQHPGYTWVGPPGTPAGATSAFRAPEEFSVIEQQQGPGSPLARAQDRSFMYPQDRDSAVNESVRYHSQTPGTAAAQSRSFHESTLRQPAPSGHTSMVSAKSAVSGRVSTSPGRPGTSPSAGQGNSETDRKRRDTKKAGAVDIVQKFLEIYENDQKDITKRYVASVCTFVCVPTQHLGAFGAKSFLFRVLVSTFTCNLVFHLSCRLERLGAAKPSRSNSANRRRLRKATAAVKRQEESDAAAEEEAERAASPPRQEVRRKDKSPGEVLSRFFLNYKKDRKALIER